MKLEKIDVKNFSEYKNHEVVYHFLDKEVNLEGFIGIHSTIKGPATGGTRWWYYQDKKDAIRDALDLSFAMTNKCVMSNLNFGGGKAVILKKGNKNEKLLAAYAKIIDSLGGKYTTGPDVGIDEEDTVCMSKYSKFILGHKPVKGKRYSTSDMAARGVYISIKSAIKMLMEKNDLNGISVAIKGLGKVGGELARLLLADGCDVIGSEIDKVRLDYIKKNFPKIKIVSPDEINSLPVMVYSPCAVGHEFNELNMKNIKAKFIIGGANNQLTSDKVGDYFHLSDIFYAPDYVVNAGGLINITDELEPDGYSADRVLSRVDNIGKTLSDIIIKSNKDNMPTYKVADILANEKLKYAYAK